MFKDYYSILRLSYPASDEDIKNAYTTIINALGFESSKPDNPNYQARVDTEEAFRVLGTYILRTAYDKEYQKAHTEGKETYQIKDACLLSGIKREQDFVISKILCSNCQPPKIIVPKKKGCGVMALGCLGKTFSICIVFMTLVYVSKCSRDRVRDSYEATSTISSDDSAESELSSLVVEKNINLPQDMNECITVQEVLLENDALVYVYKVDDAFFSEFKGHAFSKDVQLNNLKTVYREMKPVIDLLKETHRGIYYRYICRESGETTEFKIYYSDLVTLE